MAKKRTSVGRIIFGTIWAFSGLLLIFGGIGQILNAAINPGISSLIAGAIVVLSGIAIAAGVKWEDISFFP